MTSGVSHRGASIVFDAEPLIAYLEDEPGSDEVQNYIDQIENGDISAAISPIQETEIRYVSERLGDEEPAKIFLRTLKRNGLKSVPAEKVVGSAAGFKSKGHSLGDSFALATAQYEMATLVVGADSDFEAIDEYEPFNIERIRQESV